MGSWPGGSSHDAWEGYMEVEREQLAQRATGKMARMIGYALPGELQPQQVPVLAFTYLAATTCLSVSPSGVLSGQEHSPVLRFTA